VPTTEPGVTIAHLVIGGDVAGGQLVALALARAARARGDRVVFLSPARGPFTAMIEREGMDVHLVDVSRTFHLLGALRLVRLLRRLHVDVLHTHTALAANVLSRVAGRLAGVAVVSHIHIENHFRRNRLARAVHSALDNASAGLAARVIAVSLDTRDSLVAQGYPARLVEVVHNGIDVDAASAGGADGLRAELGISADAPLVGEIARLCDVKGQRELIEAAALVADVHVALAGDDLEQGGAYRERLETLARERDVADRVHFLGYRADAAELLEQLDALVLPSWIEGLPISVLEAMAHAKPVIATPVGGTAELVVDGETGMLVPPRDPAALAKALRTLIRDPERARRLGLAGRRRAEREFSEAAMTARVLEVYDAVA
jgi:glycosyltransferase involved in cell wall biosynthesis